ncbi:MAG TPA: DUF1622 domain-containing protein [Thermomicrobiales bacterium]|nr:DUF1622 domain-containing protein [Thermomicrobiales bacterium]
MIQFEDGISIASLTIEAAVPILIVGLAISLVRYLNRLRAGVKATSADRACRVRLGRVVLLGLEFLVAAGNCRTVGVYRT